MRRRVLINYVKNNYDMNEDNIRRKLKHSLKTSKISKKLAKSLVLDKNNVELAYVIGLLHDYARFYQWTNFHTFTDRVSIDHGAKAIEFLFKNNDIENYYKDETKYDIIKDAIYNHNKYMIDDSIKGINLIHSEIIRDADKIDIFRVLNEKNYVIKEDDCKISDDVSKSFYEHTSYPRNDLENKSDDFILKLAMVFDLNTKESYKILNKKKYINKLYKKIKNKEKFKPYFDYVIEYIRKKCK